MTKTYIVSLIGCDDERVFFATLSDEQAAGLRLVSRLSHEKHSCCKPLLDIVEPSDASDHELEAAKE